MISELFQSHHDETDPRGTAKRPMELDELRAIVTRVLSHRGIAVRDARALDRDGATRLETMGSGTLRDARQIVYLEAKPRHGRVGHDVVDALAADVRDSEASAGMLFTPYHVDRSTAPDAGVPLEIVDGLALERLVEHLDPVLAPVLKRFRLAGTEPA